MISWKYTKFQRGVYKNEHLLIISEEGNKELLEYHFILTETKTCVLARIFLCVFWVKPAYDKIDNNAIMGTFSGDTGGSISKWIQNAVGPSTMLSKITKNQSNKCILKAF